MGAPEPATNFFLRACRHLPRRVEITDVTPRDGLQARPEVIPPERRADLVRGLLAAGFPRVEAGSFVHPGRLPQMAGCEVILAALPEAADRLTVLVPNRRGAERALAAGARHLHLLLSTTESHSRANLGRDVETVLEELAALAPELAGAGVTSRVAVSMAWHDPVEGPVPRDRVVGLCGRLRECGYEEITLCDTYGAALPTEVVELVEAVEEHFAPPRVVVHLHDTFGFAALNTVAALSAGITRFETSLAGLGGCPFAPGARGNMAGEDLVRLLEGLGVVTGVGLGELSVLKAEIEALLASQGG